MRKAYRSPKRRDRELITVLTAISRVSARMAKPLPHLNLMEFFMTIEPTITKLKNAAELIDEAVNELSALLQNLGTSEQSVPGNESQPSATEVTTATTATAEPELTLEDVRGVLSDIARSGNREGVKSLLEKYGASKLSAIDPNDYAALLKDAEGLKNA